MVRTVLQQAITHFDRHPRAMEPMRKQSALPEQSLVTRAKLNLGYRESVAQVKRTIHVRIREVSKPSRILLIYLGG